MIKSEPIYKIQSTGKRDSVLLAQQAIVSREGRKVHPRERRPSRAPRGERGGVTLEKGGVRTAATYSALRHVFSVTARRFETRSVSSLSVARSSHLQRESAILKAPKRFRASVPSLYTTTSSSG